jgi:hypothetical protein
VADTQSDQELSRAIADRRHAVDREESEKALAFSEEAEAVLDGEEAESQAQAGTMEASE